MKMQKSIAYAFPGSANAKKLNMPGGCYYVEQTLINIEGSGQCKTIIAHNCEGFNRADDPDLIALFNEYEGDISHHFLEHGNRDALNAIANAI